MIERTISTGRMSSIGRHSLDTVLMKSKVAKRRQHMTAEITSEFGACMNANKVFSVRMAFVLDNWFMFNGSLEQCCPITCIYTSGLEYSTIMYISPNILSRTKTAVVLLDRLDLTLRMGCNAAHTITSSPLLPFLRPFALPPLASTLS